MQTNQTQFDAGTIFSGKASGTMITGFDAPSDYTPVMESSYQFHDSSRDIIVWFLMENADPLYVYGPVGCGKSSLIRQLSARLNYPVFEINGHERVEMADLIGHLSVQEGSMRFEYGPLAKAMKMGGLFLFNEIDLCSPSTLAGLNIILDGAPLCIAENGGELITPHPLFRFVATANTNGSGDDTGLYQGTQRQNLAWLDRFMLCELSYPAEEIEKDLLCAHYASLPQEIAHKMVDYAQEVRKLFMGENNHNNLNSQIEVTFSTRTLLRWAELTLRFQPLAHQGIQPITYALDRALGYRASRETRALLHELAQRIFPQQNTQTHSAQYLTPTATTSHDSHDATHWEHRVGRLVAADLSKVASLPIVALVKSSTSGGKFWKAELQANSVLVTWGKLGTRGQSLTIDRNQCKQHDPALECISRIKSKLNGGYLLDATNTKI